MTPGPERLCTGLYITTTCDLSYTIHMTALPMPTAMPATLPDQVRELVSEDEYARIGPVAEQIQRNRSIRKEVDRLREEKGFTVRRACAEVADGLPHDFSTESVWSIYYGRR